MSAAKRYSTIVDPKTNRPVRICAETGNVIPDDAPGIDLSAPILPFNEDESSNHRMLRNDTDRVLRGLLSQVVSHDCKVARKKLIRSIWIVAAIAVGVLIFAATVVFLILHHR